MNQQSSTQKQYQPHRQDRSIDEVIEFCQKNSLNSIQIGSWIWVKFDRKPSEFVRKLLLRFGFRWSKRRKMWAHNCGHPCQPGNDKPWHKYNCSNISGSVSLDD